LETDHDWLAPNTLAVIPDICIARRRVAGHVYTGKVHVLALVSHGVDKRTDDPTLESIATTEQELLTLIERMAAADALTAGDRSELSFRAGILCAELRACADTERQA